MKTYGVIFVALADPTRRRVFERLSNGPRSVGHLAADMPVSRPAVSQHLKVLKNAGLVRESRQGTRRFYEIDPAGLLPLRSYLEQFWGDVLEAFADAANEQKGMQNEQ